MDMLWPGAGIEAARNSLRQALHLARRIMEVEHNGGCQFLCDRNSWLVLSLEEQSWVDVEVFEMATREARRLRDPAAYLAALALYAGELLPEDRYEDWVEPQGSLR
jgi:DNA-binding SARP family transcriptional activator